jgi:serine/threonine protein kinase
MSQSNDADAGSRKLADLWCERQGAGWSLVEQIGRGGTAPVFRVNSPSGNRALKILDEKYSTGHQSEIQRKRVDLQVALGEHNCPSLVKVFGGGEFEGRLYVLMSCAPGKELLKILPEVPRNKIRLIVDQVARACIFLRQQGLCHRDIKSENIFVSDDFSSATVLDVSVARDVHDPLGLGTDQDGQLPIVATARYSPPEYLFRLLDPSPELWHALDVYQLGGLLHDLIMRKPLFEAEYQESKDNRYRFAWIVATSDPTVEAADVEPDLIFLARRALNKKWEMRSELKLEDFLCDLVSLKSNALSLLGLSEPVTVYNETAQHQIEKRRLANDLAEEIERRLVLHLRTKQVTPRHQVKPGATDWSKNISLSWELPDIIESVLSGPVTFALSLSIRDESNRRILAMSAMLSAKVNDRYEEAWLSLPDTEYSESAIDELCRHCELCLPDLGKQLVTRDQIDQTEG